MRVLVAGASGAIGRPLVAQLVAAGHTVVGMTRSDHGAQALRAVGAEPVVADALDAAAVEHAVRGARPEVVIEQLTALPRHYTPDAMRDALAASNQVRTVGGANVQAAAERAGARRYIAQSGCYYYVPGPGLATEETSFAVDAPPLIAGGARALLGIEKRVLGARSLEGIVLRYGFFYGPGTWYAAQGSVAEQVRRRQFPITGGGGGVWSFVHIADAAAATLAALTRGARGAYNVRTMSRRLLLGGCRPMPAGSERRRQHKSRPTRLRTPTHASTRCGGAEPRTPRSKHELGLRPRRREWLGDAK